MPDLEILGAPQSNYVRTVRMACVEKGVPYTLTPARPHSSEVDAIHPFGKIPVMRHGDIRLFESKAIATYVDRTFSGPKLIPDDPCAAAEVEQWISTSLTMIFPAFSVYLQAHVFPKGPDGQPDRAVIEGALPNVLRNITLLDRAVSRTGHLAGDTFTLADMYPLPILEYLRLFPESGEMVSGASNLDAYFKTHAQRASFRSTVPPPLSELPRR